MKIFKNNAKEIIRYIIAGILTTIVSLVSYFLLVNTILDANNPLQLQVANVLSWIFAVAFAFFINRGYVFESKNQKMISQFVAFCFSRVGTLLIDMGFMFLLVTCLQIDDGISKIVVQFIVMVLNYVFSKFLVFNKKEKKVSTNIVNYVREHQYVAWWTLIFLLLCILCYLFPYAGDDWAWGSFIGMDRLNSGFDDYGGRYVGYAIVMGMVRFRVLRALFMAGTITGIGICMARIVKRKWAFFTAIIMMFFVAVDVFAQSVSWISGFANYGTTALVVLAFLCLMIRIVDGKKSENKLFSASMLLFGLVGSLIMENVTVYLVVMSMGVQLYLWVKERRFSLTMFLFSIGAVIGAVLMFSNSAYHNIAVNQDDYRSVTFSDGGVWGQIMGNYLETIYPFGLFKNIVLNVLFAITGVLLMVLKQNFRKKIPTVCLTFFGIYAIITVISELVIGETDELPLITNMEACLSLLGLLSLLTTSLYVGGKNTEIRKKMILLWLSFFILVGPLFLINPIGPRNMFTPYILLVTINMLEWREVFSAIRKKMDMKTCVMFETVMRNAGAIVTTSVIAVMIGVFAVVYKADNSRIEIVRNAVSNGERSVVIDHLPFEELMWSVTPVDDVFNERFKIFYGVPMDVEVVVEPQTE